jgi:hypothetical protein
MFSHSACPSSRAQRTSSFAAGYVAGSKAANQLNPSPSVIWCVTCSDTVIVCRYASGS